MARPVSRRATENVPSAPTDKEEHARRDPPISSHHVPVLFSRLRSVQSLDGDLVQATNYRGWVLRPPTPPPPFRTWFGRQAGACLIAYATDGQGTRPEGSTGLHLSGARGAPAPPRVRALRVTQSRPLASICSWPVDRSDQTGAGLPATTFERAAAA